ncbi:hypothetical protein F3Y22_tig00111662pilonHSYRG00208 [Hibiscus syriacus]|uniref:Exocyst subunit Exo70 family protein n=1 Tax=Hibiscus syriacus TaxID=106335 RepID=A0A6A2YIR5_HIBSY|nr:hypothetical protein F3Y22_tig00111662pilonHSYRG00208 [Hibiscus syriacus]
MYDVLADALLDFKMMVMDEFVCCEVKGVLAELGDTEKWTFMEFENALKNEASKIPMHNGEIHPYTLPNGLDGEDIELETKTPFAKRLLSLTSYLETNLEEKSKLYEDCALHFIFFDEQYSVHRTKGEEFGAKKAFRRQLDEGIGSSSNNVSKVTLRKDLRASMHASKKHIGLKLVGKSQILNFVKSFDYLYRRKISTGSSPCEKKGFIVSESHYRYGPFAHQHLAEARIFT